MAQAGRESAGERAKNIWAPVSGLSPGSLGQGAAWARGVPFQAPSPLQALAAWACATNALRDADQAQQADHDAATQQADPNQEDNSDLDPG